LQYLADYGHELMLVQIWSEEDRMPPWTGELDLIDSESGDTLKLHFDDEARRRYTASFDEYVGTLQQLAGRCGGRYIGISTQMPLEEVMFNSMVRAQGLA
jgi:hypothetical protein